jgi:hypothetical protein
MGTANGRDGLVVDRGRLQAAVERLLESERPRYRRLWAYYKNPMRVCGASGGAAGAGSDRPYRQGQEWGLPGRITGMRSGVEPFADAATGVAGGRKEVVIENDIAWRVDTMSDYLFGKPLVIESAAAADPRRRAVIGRLLRLILAHNGGIRFLQQLAQLGSVYGFVDVLVKAVGCGADAGAGEPAGTDHERTDGCGTGALGEAPVTGGGAAAGGGVKSSPDAHGPSGTRAEAGLAPGADGPAAASMDAPPASDAEGAEDDEDGRVAGADVDGEDEALLRRVARMIRLEIVEPARALPLLSCEDYRVVEAYGQVWEKEGSRAADHKSGEEGAPSWWGKVVGLFERGSAPLLSTAFRAGRVADKRGAVTVVDVITPDAWCRTEDGRVVARGRNSLGDVPVVHIQNSATAFEYAGGSDVEPLIPLQDELNTRLSDRAHRITLQSFRMYLARGFDGLGDQPVSPGRMWQTDNEGASIVEFGGDSSCPSEEAHISDLREALDKASGVSPVAAGAIKNRIGRLTSAAALRVTLLALLSKTDKKRALYGAGIERMCELALRWLDVAGVFRTTPDERRVELSWPSPLPENEMEKLAEAEVKVRLGVERGVVLRELGY